MVFNFLLHANQFTERGDSVDLLLMSSYLKELLDTNSVIAFPKNSEINRARLVEALNAGHKVYQYSSRSDLEKFIEREQITHNYLFNNGKKNDISYLTDTNTNPILCNTTHITRAVFRNYEPFGDFYLYVSEWLFNWSKRKISFSKIKKAPTFVSWLPHMVDPRLGNGESFKRKFKIPPDVKVIGRIGGKSEFSDNAAKLALIEYLNLNKEVFVVLVNTENFYSHSRIRYIDYLSRQEIWDFYEACDLFLNGRKMGETFGFSVVEPLSLGKPVIAPGIFRNPLMDKHHIHLLRSVDLLYSSKSDLIYKIQRELNHPTNNQKLKDIVLEFSPKMVMKKFSEIVF